MSECKWTIDGRNRSTQRKEFFNILFNFSFWSGEKNFIKNNSTDTKEKYVKNVYKEKHSFLWKLTYTQLKIYYGMSSLVDVNLIIFINKTTTKFYY